MLFFVRLPQKPKPPASPQRQPFTSLQREVQPQAHQQSQQVVQHLRQVKANHFLERRIVL
jgi:hypothetical protein